MRRVAAAILFVTGLSPTPALAFRPFDGTEASIADTGAMEMALGPVRYLRQGSEHSLVAPALEITRLDDSLDPRSALANPPNGWRIIDGHGTVVARSIPTDKV
jgi:hypothetical protein